MKLADLHMSQPETICDFCSLPLNGESKSFHSKAQFLIPLEDTVLYHR